MPITLSVDATKAYNQIGRIEKELRSLFGVKGQKANKVSRSKRDQGRITAPLRNVVATAVADTIYTANLELTGQAGTPIWSGWLISNWKWAQGGQPALTSLPTPQRTKDKFSPPDPIPFGSIDGTKKQWLFNNTKYAEDAAAGGNPFSRTGQIVSGGGPAWFLTIGQRVQDGTIFKTALARAISRSK